MVVWFISHYLPPQFNALLPKRQPKNGNYAIIGQFHYLVNLNHVTLCCKSINFL